MVGKHCILNQPVMKKKNYLITLLITAVLVICNTCQFFEKDEDEEELVELPTVEIYTNPSDPSLMKITDLDGTTLTYFGDKDEEGIVESINHIIVDFADVEGATYLAYDSIKRPSRVETSNGTLYEFIWLTETKMRIKVASPSGEVQLNIPYDFDASDKNLPALMGASGHENIRNNIKPNASIRAMPSSKPSAIGHPENMKALQTIQVMRCGEPVENASVRIFVEPAIGSFQLSPLAYSGADGVYQVQIPHSFEPPTYLDLICEGLKINLTKVCEANLMQKFQTQFEICNLLHEMFGQDPGAINEQQKKILQSCYELAQAIKVTCAIIMSNPELKKDFCKKYFGSGNQPGEEISYIYRLEIKVPGEETFITQTTAFDPNLPNAWTYDVGGETSVENLHTIPVDPAPHQGYTAYAYVVCPEEAGTEVTIAVQGNDGYSNSETFTITENSMISLWVPGAVENTVDIVTVTTPAREWTITIIF
jgi:hypothetical protein